MVVLYAFTHKLEVYKAGELRGTCEKPTGMYDVSVYLDHQGKLTDYRSAFWAYGA